MKNFESLVLEDFVNDALSMNQNQVLEEGLKQFLQKNPIKSALTGGLAAATMYGMAGSGKPDNTYDVSGDYRTDGFKSSDVSPIKKVNNPESIDEYKLFSNVEHDNVLGSQVQVIKTYDMGWFGGKSIRGARIGISMRVRADSQEEAIQIMEEAISNHAEKMGKSLKQFKLVESNVQQLQRENFNRTSPIFQIEAEAIVAY